METPIDLVLLTGFLGAGKTTLLNSVLDAAASTPERIAVLMNEFGKVGVDGALVHKTDGLSVFEVSDGSIFCTCRSASFVTGLRLFARMPAERKPARLIVEASGMSDPSGLTRLLRENRLAGDYRVVKVVCIVDAVQFVKIYGILPAVSRQLEAADLVVLNKTDLASDLQLEETEAQVRAVNADATIVRARRAMIDEKSIWEGGSRDLAGELVSCTVPEARPAALHLGVPGQDGAERRRLESFFSAAVAITYRIKGWMRVDGSWYYISDNSGRIEWLEDAPPAGTRTGLVVICSPDEEDKVARLWREGVAA